MSKLNNLSYETTVTKVLLEENKTATHKDRRKNNGGERITTYK